MPDRSPSGSERDQSFFVGQIIIDILTWDWNLRLAISSAAMRPKARFQGLEFGRDFTIRGRVRAPRELRGKIVKVVLSPFGPRVRFGRGGLQQIGRLTMLPAGGEVDFEAMLMLPEGAIATTAMSLASIWKHVDIRISGAALQGASVSSYSFAAAVHPDVPGWSDDE